MQSAATVELLQPHHLSWNERYNYRAYTLGNFDKLPQIGALSAEQKHAIEVVGRVFPFKTNSYIVEELIDWGNIPDDPLFVATFPQRDMLEPHHFEAVASLLHSGANEYQLQETVNRIRMELNPHPAGQMQNNVPTLEGVSLRGLQHKYCETVLFFPYRGQTCHAYCSFCFRWPQFVGIDTLRFSARGVGQLIAYLEHNPQVTDVLITGGDPLIMSADALASYLVPLLERGFRNLRTIRIGTKVLSNWPYRLLTDYDTEELLALFRLVPTYGKSLAIMAHFNHPRELQTNAARQAIGRMLETGACIRTQSPLLAGINDNPTLWEQLWREQVGLGCVPYYMFVMRNTGAQYYFGVPLVQAWRIFRQAYQAVSGLARTVRGPVMSAHPGKCQILGESQVNGERVLILHFLQGRDPDWVSRPFFARYDPQALWLTDLEPAFGAERFFFE
jgi:L-lysine 2,3-aminomutase